MSKKKCLKLISATLATDEHPTVTVWGKIFLRLVRRKQTKCKRPRVHIHYPSGITVDVAVDSIESNHVLTFTFSVLKNEPFVIQNGTTNVACYVAKIYLECSCLHIGVCFTLPTPSGCSPGLTSCGSTCTDLKTDPINCGTCGVVCVAPNTVCDGGGCLLPVSCRVNNACDSVAAVCALDCSAFPPSGTTLVVSPTGPAGAQVFTTIQAAVNAAASGDRIVVCPSTYVEQVVIPNGKNGLVLQSLTPVAVIQSPVVLLGNNSIVTVDAQCTSILGFTVQGPDTGLQNGIFVENGGSAIIQGNSILSIRDDPLLGVQRGLAIRIQGVGTRAIISGNTVADYQKTGILVNLGACAQIRNNTVTGNGLAGLAAENGIQISRGAFATVENNTVTANQFFSTVATGCVASAGILLFQLNGGVCIRNNNASSNQFGIALLTMSNIQITGNTTNNNVLIGEPTCQDPLNNGVGIWAFSDTFANVISLNTSLNNQGTDAVDFSTGSPMTFEGSCGTANSWLCNVCASDNRGGCLCSSTTAVSAPTLTPPLLATAPVSPE